MIVCLCKAVCDQQIASAIDDGARSVDEVGSACGAGTGCGACREFIAEMIDSACDAGACVDCPRGEMSVVSPYLKQSKDAA